MKALEIILEDWECPWKPSSSTLGEGNINSNDVHGCLTCALCAPAAGSLCMSACRRSHRRAWVLLVCGSDRRPSSVPKYLRTLQHQKKKHTQLCQGQVIRVKHDQIMLMNTKPAIFAFIFWGFPKCWWFSNKVMHYFKTTKKKYIYIKKISWSKGYKG